MSGQAEDPPATDRLVRPEKLWELLNEGLDVCTDPPPELPGPMERDKLTESQWKQLCRITRRVGCIRVQTARWLRAQGADRGQATASPRRTSSDDPCRLVHACEGDDLFAPDFNTWPPTDNVIGILGDRGVGKTTALLTMLHALSGSTAGRTYVEGVGRIRRDIILPPVDPEMFNGDAEFVLAWVFAGMKEQVDALDHFWRRQEDHGRHGFAKPRLTDVQATYREVRETLALIGGRFRDRAVKLATTREDFVHEVFNLQKSGRALQGSIRRFFEAYFEAYDGILRCCHGRPGGSASTCPLPLLFVSFDDIDICTRDVVTRLLHMVHAYLRHPRVVVFVLGHREQFERALYEERVRHFRSPEILGPGGLSHHRRLSAQVVQKLLPERSRFKLAVVPEDALRRLREDLAAPRLPIPPAYRAFRRFKDEDSTAGDSLLCLFDYPSGLSPLGETTATRYAHLLRGNLHHQRALRDWLSRATVAREEAVLLEDVQGLMRTFATWAADPGFAAVTEDILSFDELHNRLSVDFGSLLAIRRGEKRELPGDLALSVCFLHDLLELLGKCLGFKWTARRSVTTRQSIQRELFYKEVWSDLAPSNPPVGEDWWFQASAIAFLSREVVRWMLRPLTLSAAAKTEILSYLFSDQTKAAKDPVAQALVQAATVLAAAQVCWDDEDRVAAPEEEDAPKEKEDAQEEEEDAPKEKEDAQETEGAAHGGEEDAQEEEGAATVEEGAAGLEQRAPLVDLGAADWLAEVLQSPAWFKDHFDIEWRVAVMETWEALDRQRRGGSGDGPLQSGPVFDLTYGLSEALTKAAGGRFNNVGLATNLKALAERGETEVDRRAMVALAYRGDIVRDGDRWRISDQGSRLLDEVGTTLDLVHGIDATDKKEPEQAESGVRRELERRQYVTRPTADTPPVVTKRGKAFRTSPTTTRYVKELLDNYETGVPSLQHPRARDILALYGVETPGPRTGDEWEKRKSALLAGSPWPPEEAE